VIEGLPSALTRLLIGLCIGLINVLPASASTCLLRTVPEVRESLADVNADTRQALIERLAFNAQGRTLEQAAPWQTARASLLIDLGEFEAAEQLLDQAIRGWARSQRTDAEICARHLLIYSLATRFQSRQALSELLLAEERARGAGLSEALERLRQTHITLLLTLNTRIEEGLVLLQESSPGADLHERINWHHNRGLLLGRLRRHREAAREFEQLLELSTQAGLAAMTAATRFNLANQLIQAIGARYGGTSDARIVALLDRVIEDREARPSTRALALRSRALLKPPSERAPWLQQCIEQARNGYDRRRQAICLAELAELTLPSDSSLAVARLSEALELADSDPLALTQILIPQLNIVWATRPPPQAFAESLALLDSERRQREQQMYGPERARVIDRLTNGYRSLADRAYHHAVDYPQLIERAFNLLESHRALVLRERQRLSRDRQRDVEIEALAALINQAQQRLLDSETPTDRTHATATLEALEARWKRITLRDPDAIEPITQGLSLAQLQRSLSTDEAVLSFLTDLPDGGRDAAGWLHLVTNHESIVVAIPPQALLRNAANLLHGLEDWNASGARQIVSSLGTRLVQPVLARLPEAIKHLIVIPDAGIADLPLELLTSADGEPIGLSHAVDYTPSATVWLAARSLVRTVGPVRVLADPDLPANSFRALDAAFPERSLPPLTGARQEARLIARTVQRGQVETRLGDQASEASVSRAPFQAAGGVVHFATHSLIHPTRPERSAVLLAPGDADFDGLLQSREIERLELPGSAVVLASCASASGQWLRGEGVTSLARSFLIAGAPSVLATRWPVDDRQSAVFFARFYRHLSDGADLSNALKKTRRDLAAQAYPMRFWAAYVLYGDGRWRPVEVNTWWPPLLWLLAGTGIGLIAIGRLFKGRGLDDD